MAYGNISRRRFIERSISASFAAALGPRFGSLQGTASATTPDIEGLTLKVNGDPKQGYGVSLLLRGQPFARHNQGGEFSATFKNEERSVEDGVIDWKATSWSGNSTHVMLDGECRLKSLNTAVLVRVEYEVVTPHVVRKKIRLEQADMYMLFYKLSNQLEPEEGPAKLWSFDQLEWKGGVLHEYFPAAGFRAKDGLCVGLLTDAGYRNQWTRIIRRDGKPVKPAPRRIPDANLYSSSRAEEQRDVFIQQTFGEILEQPFEGQNEQTVILPDIILPDFLSWKKQ